MKVSEWCERERGDEIIPYATNACMHVYRRDVLERVVFTLIKFHARRDIE